MLEAPFFTRITDVLRLHAPATAIESGLRAAAGLVAPPETVARVAGAIQLHDLVRSTLQTGVLVGGLFVVFAMVEHVAGRGTRWRSRVFAQDVAYAFFYQGGFYAILVWAAIANAVEPRLDVLRIGALARLPGPVHWLLYWIVVDFITYWWHRLLHSWGPLWAIHSVHHTQEEMSFISSYRLHPVEQVAQNLLMVVPLLVMGVPTWRWLPLYATMALFEAAQHSALPWDYGRAHRLFVSPVFHAVHHSADPRHHNRNFAKILSLWDFLFGTGVQEAAPPARLGVDGLPVPRTIGAQLAAPFRIWSRRDRMEGVSPIGAAARAVPPTPATSTRPS